MLALVRQALGGGEAFLHQPGVLLGHHVHLRDGFVGLADALALLIGGGGDFAHQGAETANVRHHAGDDLAGAAHLLAAGGDQGAGAFDQGLDLAGGLGTAAGQITHFFRHHREPAALLAGAGRFHGSVESKNIGLERDLVDGIDDGAHLLGTVVDAAHGLDHGIHGLAAAAGIAGGTVGQLPRLFGVVRVLLHGGGELFHAGGGFGE